MRTSIATLAAVLMLAGSSVYAQQAPVRTEGAFSPLTYERLGATPSIRLPRAAGPASAGQAEAKAQAALKSPARTCRTAPRRPTCSSHSPAVTA